MSITSCFNQKRTVMAPESDRICSHYILLEEENTMIINIFLKANTRANTKILQCHAPVTKQSQIKHNTR